MSVGRIRSSVLEPSNATVRMNFFFLLLLSAIIIGQGLECPRSGRDTTSSGNTLHTLSPRAIVLGDRVELKSPLINQLVERHRCCGSGKGKPKTWEPGWWDWNRVFALCFPAPCRELGD